MAKIRIYELARDLNVTNKELVEKIRNMDIYVKSHMSSLDDEDVTRIKNKYGYLCKKPYELSG
ncbi:MAG: translation initiation factor IF-2 N-terminal domain-containing protein [Deltaproteobacteria bacterium]|nr:translation initiation factor IF-2 N-terminal domain-containing protein [Deltaproteobacteria bacterium]